MANWVRCRVHGLLVGRDVADRGVTSGEIAVRTWEGYAERSPIGGAQLQAALEGVCARYAIL